MALHGPQAALTLADWREQTARLYLSDLDLADFRAARDRMFATHPQSPIPSDQRAGFGGLSYFADDPSYRVTVPLTAASGEMEIDTGGPDGVLRYDAIAVARTPWGPLTLWWLCAYGGGLFLPFRDGTSGSDSYGGGRYLTDTVKGTFGRGVTLLGPDRAVLDFRYAYHPSCVYDSRWACPLAPPENRLEAPIRAGERLAAPQA